MGKHASFTALTGIETIFGKDVDDVFAYTVPRYVKIRDARLGLMQYALMVGILCYVIISAIIVNLGYLSFGTPTGTVEFTLSQPTLSTEWNPNRRSTTSRDTCCSTPAQCKHQGKNKTNGEQNIVNDSSNPDKCTGPPCVYTGCAYNKATGVYTSPSCCYSNYTSLSALTYCKQYQGSKPLKVDGKLHQADCEFFDGTTASFKSKDGIFVATKKSIETQIAHTSPRAPQGSGATCGCPNSDRSSCSNAKFKNGSYMPGSYSCSATWHTNASDELYVADAENFIVYIDHITQQYDFDPKIQVDSKDVSGWLQVDASTDPDERALQDELCRNHISSGPSAGNDAVQVSYNATGARTSKAPCMVPQGFGHGGRDFFSVKTLLQAAGKSLDGAGYEPGMTIRDQVRVSGANPMPRSIHILPYT
jgi:hypothetical protein